MKQQREQQEKLSGNVDGSQIQQAKQILNINTSTKNILTISIVMFTAIILYQITQRIFAISNRQQQVKNTLQVYQQAVLSLQKKMKMLNEKSDNPFTAEQLLKYELLLKKIKNLEETFQGVSSSGINEQISHEMAEVLDIIEKAIAERSAILNLLIAHSKEQIRKKKIYFFEKIGKKSEFQQQNIRNPWALSRLNLRTPYIDTLQRRHMQEQIQKQAERLEQKYHFSQYEHQLPLCVIVPTRNNVKNYRYQYNLQSIINQNYQNYKLVIIDDASDDGTGELIQLFLKNSKFPPQKYSLIHNKQRLTAVPNIYNAIKNYCSKDDIVVLVSGDDELLGKLVFKILNAVYQTKKPGIAYTNHFYGKLHDNDFEKGYSRSYTLGQIKNKLYRYIGQKFGHMRTFPVSIFLQIKEQSMKNRDGTWIQATYDQTFILPILEMACDSIEYIDEYVYIYNYGTGQNDGEIHHDIQSKAALYVRELPRYNCIEKYQKYVI